jgi:hypothetical protein
MQAMSSIRKETETVHIIFFYIFPMSDTPRLKLEYNMGPTLTD